jgi:hypothetical protein
VGGRLGGRGVRQSSKELLVPMAAWEKECKEGEAGTERRKLGRERGREGGREGYPCLRPPRKDRAE